MPALMIGFMIAIAGVLISSVAPTESDQFFTIGLFLGMGIAFVVFGLFIYLEEKKGR